MSQMKCGRAHGVCQEKCLSSGSLPTLKDHRMTTGHMTALGEKTFETTARSMIRAKETTITTCDVIDLSIHTGKVRDPQA